MDQIVGTLEVGLRVLTAVNEHKNPDPMDVEKLRLLAPEWADRPVDELACEVIGRTMKQRSKAAQGPGSRS